MIKRITVAELQPGMFVHDLDCGWMSHPFLRNRFRIQGEAQIRDIVEAGIRNLHIDTARGLDAVYPPTRIEVGAALEPGLAEAVESGKAAAGPEASQGTSIDEEFRIARRVHAEANRVVRNLLQETRLGKQVSVEQAEPIVEKIADSILRSPDPCSRCAASRPGTNTPSRIRSASAH